ncbi:hypothetical protein [Streptomyces sp. 2P-4]|uniref:hypothetical protein n=1 Tax=Streptomyces sp. 2P-4 TaxID=2931974 RepID=UPI0025420F8D|nr:hypothetical protein [Streptomyces sp. 2P-4]
MPSPNGYFDCGTSTNVTRNWWRQQLTHDVTSPPWDTDQAAGYEFEINIGTAAAGPFSAAPLTALSNECAPAPSNRLGFSTADQTVFGVGGPAELLADTDYWLEIVLYDETDTEVDRFVCGPTHTEPYPTFTCLVPDTTETSGDVALGATSGRVNVSGPCNQDSVVWEIATAPGGPYTAAPSEPVDDLSPSHTFTGLTEGTTYYYRARFTEQAQGGGEYLVTQECSFTTLEGSVTTPPFQPLPCDSGGAGADAVDVEQIVLCDLDAEGNLLGTALAVYEYDTEGNPTGAPTFVDPATGNPYVPQGTLQPCPDAACLPPMQFCQTSTTTGPVEHPGRQYDITLPINPGFAVQSLQVDAVSHAAGITWEVDDPDGETFREELTTFIEGRVPAAATVTITNPNAGVPQVCGAAQPMTVHIECVRLDQSPPDLIELVYNAGQDLIQNPAYNEFPPLDPPVSQGNYGFRLLSREDDPGPFPGNQPANDALCTSVANRGWETNDVGRTFEIWGQDIVNGSNVTPTPRGTPVQEMTSDGPPPGGLSTIWQTFQAPATGNFIIRVVHGARDPGETHRITLDNGDTDDAQNGDLIDDTSNPASVTNNGGPNPWTQFSQTIPLNAGSTYTLALSSTNPVSGARGGLFTDMRAYIDRPDRRATATTDDDTCVVVTEETTTNTICSFWQPQCAGGAVVGWQKVDTGETLTNAEFWAQVPTPGCCLPETSEGEGGSALSNMLASDIVCATVGGVPQNAIRVMVTDPSGGTLQVLFLGTDGAPIAPDTWTPGPCTTSRYMADQILCDDNGPFLRKYVQSLDATNQAQLNSFRDFTLGGGGYTVVGEVRQCGATDVEIVELCDRQPNNVVIPFLRRIIFDANGDVIASENVDPDGNPYNPTGTVTTCSVGSGDLENLVLCDVQLDGTAVPFLRSVLYLPAQGGFAGAVNDWELDGTTPYTVTGTVQLCQPDTADREAICYTLTSTGDTLHAGWARHQDSIPNTPVTPNGLAFFDALGNFLDPTADGFTVVPCAAASTSAGTVADSESVVLCDVNAGVPTRFVRTYVRDADGLVTAVVDNTFAGGTYTPTGAVGACAEAGDSESFILCDSAGTPNRFIRTYTYGANGAVSGFTDTTLAGAPFVPTGAVGVCAQTIQSDTDFVEEVLCDGNGTPFIRLFRFNSVTGVLVSTTNTTLAGAAFAPVGTVGLCSDCCPQVIADELCTNTGSGRGTAIRANNGTVTLIDSVTGATITQANIVACPGSTVATLTAQGRVVGDADAAWTPGADVAGTLTSVTLTVLSGTATVTDADGTVMAGLPAGYSATWTAEDANTLTGPQSIDAIGGNTAVVWTQR